MRRRWLNGRIHFSCELLEQRRLLSVDTWTANTGGAWSTAANWSNNAVPQTGDDVVINKSTGLQITLTGSTSINSLTITSDSLIVNNSTLSVAANSSVGTAASITLNNATLAINNGANLTNAGSITVNPLSQLNVAGTYSASSTASLNLPSGSTTGGIGTNLLSNPGFESPAVSSSTDPDVWGSWNSASLSNQYAHGGSQSLMESGGNSGVYQSAPVSPGVTYKASLWTFTPSGNRLAGNEGLFLQLVFSDGNGTQISSPSTWIDTVDANSPANTWINTTASLAAPANAATMTMYVQIGAYTGISGTAGGAAYLDDVQLGPAAVSSAAVEAASISNSGTLSIGAGDTVTTTGTFTQTNTGVLNELLGGPAAENLFGSLTAGTSATLAGSLNVTTTGGYAPSVNDDFTLISYTSESGAFASTALPSGSGYAFQSGLNPTYFGISAVPPGLSINVSTGAAISTASTNLIGINLVNWDSAMNTTQTQQMVQAAGLSLFRFPGGSASDDYHFNQSDNNDNPNANTIPQFAKLIANVGGTGIVTVDYGSGSPQEAVAELAYLEGSTTDTTPIGTGIEWNDSTNVWQNINWQTVGYWASLRAASPLGTNDGLNFLRIAHPAAFNNIKYWEIGNEQYGFSWETDHHGANGPTGVSTGTQNSAATYAQFAATFSTLVSNDKALPSVQIGIDAGSPTGDDGVWTKAVLSDLHTAGVTPGFISDHSYMQSPGTESDSFLLNSTVSDSASPLDWTVRYNGYESMLSSVFGSGGSTVKILATEFNSNYGVEGKQMTSIVNGIFLADSIGSLMNSGYSGGLFWDLRNGWTTSGNNSPLLYGWREGGDEGILGDYSYNDPPSTGTYVPYPTYFADQLASQLIQNGGSDVSAISSYAQMTSYAVVEANGHLDLMVLNKNPDATLTETFNLTGFVPAGQASVWQYGEAQDYAQSQSSTGAAALATSTPLINATGNTFSYSFPAYSMTVIDLTPLPVFASQAGSTLTINLNPTGAVSIGSSGSNMTVSEAGNLQSFSNINAITVNGGSSNDVLNFSAALTTPITFINTGQSTLNINSGTLTVANGSGTAINLQVFSTINISANAAMVLNASAVASGRTLLDTQYLNLAGSMGNWTSLLNLNSNDLEVQFGSISTINDQVKQGFLQGNNGIFSAAASANARHLTALGAILNTIDGTPTATALFGSNKLFDGTAPPATAVLVKYTYFGDANLDGTVDGSDYTRIDNGHLRNQTGWFNGDFNCDGVINGSDYTLIDNAFNTQGAALSTQIFLQTAYAHSARPNTGAARPWAMQSAAPPPPPAVADLSIIPCLADQVLTDWKKKSGDTSTAF